LIDIASSDDVSGILPIANGGSGADNLNAIVQTTGDQTIGGDKTFTDSLVLSTPDASRPLKLDADKNIVSGLIDIASSDDVSGILPIANGGSGANNLNAIVQTSGDQTVAGNKTFSDSIKTPSINCADSLAVSLDRDGTHSSNFSVKNGDNATVFSVDESSIMTSNVIRFGGDTRMSVAKVYNAEFGDCYGIEQVSSTQSGDGAQTRIYTASGDTAKIAIPLTLPRLPDTFRPVSRRNMSGVGLPPWHLWVCEISGDRKEQLAARLAWGEALYRPDDALARQCGRLASARDDRPQRRGRPRPFEAPEKREDAHRAVCPALAEAPW